MIPDAAETNDARRRRVRGLTAGAGSLLSLSGLYLAALLAGYVFARGAIERHHLESASYLFAAAVLLTAATRTSVVPAAARASALAAARDTGGTRGWMPAAAIAIAVVLYLPTWSMGLFSDDFHLLANALRHDWLGQAEFVRPVPLLVWNVLVTITGQPAVLHALNIGLHTLNAALVYALARRVGLNKPRAALAAALFAAFPASVEAVVWPAAIHDLLVTTSALLFVLLAAQPASWPRVAAGMLVLLIALLSKESAVTIPVLAAVMWRGRSSRDARAWRLPALGLALCALYAVARMAIVAVPDAFSQAPTRYLLKELIARPIATLIVPWNTSVMEAWPAVPALWAVGCVLAAATYAWSTVRAVPLHVVVRCLVAAYVAVIPVYSALFISADLENARYLYLSTAFWAIALIALASPSPRLAPARGIVLMMAIIVAMVGVRVHMGAWREAARVRDQVLTAAADTLGNAACSPVSFVGTPDSVRGAYVFRNGLTEAIALRTGARSAPPAADCTFAWNGSGFERASGFAGPIQASVLR